MSIKCIKCDKVKLDNILKIKDKETKYQALLLYSGYRKGWLIQPVDYAEELLSKGVDLETQLNDGRPNTKTIIYRLKLLDIFTFHIIHQGILVTKKSRKIKNRSKKFSYFLSSDKLGKILNYPCEFIPYADYSYQINIGEINLMGFGCEKKLDTSVTSKIKEDISKILTNIGDTNKVYIEESYSIPLDQIISMVENDRIMNSNEINQMENYIFNTITLEKYGIEYKSLTKDQNLMLLHLHNIEFNGSVKDVVEYELLLVPALKYMKEEDIYKAINYLIKTFGVDPEQTSTFFKETRSYFHT
jgi:hypothetical protein